MIMNQISIFLENKPGKLAEITQEFDNAGINMMAINIAESSEYGLIRIIVNDTEKAMEVLQEKGFLATVSKVTLVCVSDQPGGMHVVAKSIALAGINIEYVYSMLREKEGKAYLIFKTEDPQKFEQELEKMGIEV